MPQKFSIVEFYPDDKDKESKPTAIVPNNWIEVNSSFVYWPKSISTSAVKKAIPPKKNWTIHRYTRILAEYSSYEEAVTKLPKSLDTSNLDSESEPTSPIGLPPRRPVTRYSSSSSDDSVLDSAGPSKSSSTFKVPSSPSFSLVSNAAIDPPQITTSVTDSETVVPNNTSTGASITEDPLTAAELCDPTLTIASTADITALKTFLDEFALKIFTVLEGISQEIKEIKAHLQTTRPTGSSQVLDFTKIPPLPLANRDNVINIESWINLEANKTLLTEYLGLTGGANASKAVRNILKKLISKPLRKETNFTGKGGKIAFQNLKIYECVKDSVRIIHNDAKDDEIQRELINWLRNKKKDD